ncbi:MarR family transcriptional regulator [Exiguobacterium sp.]|uniref:MarR family winged helix-turn-helix transcriptional regulator n=1 Tax=Exiguobacterium sp. TaxID=44751 RepID=UPI00289BD72A|nr:MarR family transcriptional regulator [Exiguobacterium sp.]
MACRHTIAAYHNQQIKRVNDFLKHWDLSHTNLEVLRCLHTTSCTSQKEIAERIQVTEGTISHGIKRLFDRQLITRQRKWKTNYLLLTEKGTAILQEVVPSYERFQQEQFAALTARQQEELIRFFDKLNPA